jgi:hypothetical protein
MARILPSKSAKRRPIATFALVFLVIIYISISSDGLNSFSKSWVCLGKVCFGYERHDH